MSELRVGYNELRSMLEESISGMNCEMKEITVAECSYDAETGTYTPVSENRTDSYMECTVPGLEQNLRFTIDNNWNKPDFMDFICRTNDDSLGCTTADESFTFYVKREPVMNYEYNDYEPGLATLVSSFVQMKWAYLWSDRTREIRDNFLEPLSDAFPGAIIRTLLEDVLISD